MMLIVRCLLTQSSSKTITSGAGVHILNDLQTILIFKKMTMYSV